MALTRLAALALLAAAVTLAAAAPAQFDCEAGCPLEGGAGVCADSGVTFINACLAACSGAAVARDGPCPAPGAVGAATLGGAPATALEEHPIGAFLAPDGGSRVSAAGDVGTLSAMAAAGPRVASAAAMRRFASEGLVLAGAARVGAFRPKKPSAAPAGSDDSGDITGLRVVRITPEDGLVYVSAALLDAATVDAAAAPAVAGRRPSPEGWAAARGAVLAANAGGAPAGADAAAKRALTPNPIAGWAEVNTLQPYPYTAIGSVGLAFPSFQAACSGSLFGNHSVITAAHCVYDRDTRTAVTSAEFTPHRFYTTKGTLQTPFGSSMAASYNFLTGYKTAPNSDVAFLSDQAVLLLKDGLGSAAGTLGIAHSPSGYSGQVFAAGYPGETPQPWGRYYKLKGVCTIADTNGNDGTLEFQLAASAASARRSSCLTACAIAEAGQSGQPAFVKVGSGATEGYAVIATLSYGPPTGTCQGHDTYYQMSQATFTWLTAYKDWTPK